MNRFILAAACILMMFGCTAVPQKSNVDNISQINLKNKENPPAVGRQRSNTSVSIPSGLYINGGKNGVAQEALDNPSVAGMLIQSDWKTIEPQQGEFDWSIVDDRLQQVVDSNKYARLALHIGGSDVPDWITNQLDINGGDISSIVAIKNGETYHIPAFWDPVYLDQKKFFYKQLADRYGSHPSVTAISVSMVDPFTGDWGFLGVDPQSAVDAGYDSDVFATAWYDLIREVMILAPTKTISTSIGSTPQKIIQILGSEEDSFYAFEKALTLMGADPDIDMSRLAGGKGSLSLKTPDPADLDIDELREWETMYSMINTHGAKGFGQTVWNVTHDPDYKMNGGDPYGGNGQITATEVFKEAIDIAYNYKLAWVEPWEIDILNDTEVGLQDAISDAAIQFKVSSKRNRRFLSCKKQKTCGSK